MLYYNLLYTNCLLDKPLKQENIDVVVPKNEEAQPIHKEHYCKVGKRRPLVTALCSINPIEKNLK